MQIFQFTLQKLVLSCNKAINHGLQSGPLLVIGNQKSTGKYWTLSFCHICIELSSAVDIKKQLQITATDRSFKSPNEIIESEDVKRTLIIFDYLWLLLVYNCNTIQAPLSRTYNSASVKCRLWTVKSQINAKMFVQFSSWPLHILSVQFQASFQAPSRSSTHGSAVQYVAQAMTTMGCSVGPIKQDIICIIAVFFYQKYKKS